jgi:hypothetical protein
MTDENANTADLTMNEKLDRILAELSDLKTRLAALEVRKTKSVRSSTPNEPNSDLWLDYRDAAEMMRRPAPYFRVRDGLGEYKYWPQIERWQPDGRGTRLYVRREHVEAWIERSRTPPPCPINYQMTGIGYESLVPELLRMRAYSLMRSLGLKQYIPAGATKSVAKKKGAAR